MYTDTSNPEKGITNLNSKLCQQHSEAEFLAWTSDAYYPVHAFIYTEEVAQCYELKYDNYRSHPWAEFLERTYHTYLPVNAFISTERLA